MRRIAVRRQCGPAVLDRHKRFRCRGRIYSTESGGTWISWRLWNESDQQGIFQANA